MNWTDKMKIAMKLMKEACLDGTNCCICPFVNYCDLLKNNDYYGEPKWVEMLPFNFKIDEE